MSWSIGHEYANETNLVFCHVVSIALSVHEIFTYLNQRSNCVLQRFSRVLRRMMKEWRAVCKPLQTINSFLAQVAGRAETFVSGGLCCCRSLATGERASTLLVIHCDNHIWFVKWDDVVGIGETPMMKRIGEIGQWAQLMVSNFAI